jgi:hypothetical protein
MGASFEGDTWSISLPLPTSPNSMTYRHCPNADCTPRLFQIADAPEERSLAKGLAGHIRRQPGTSGVTSPIAGRTLMTTTSSMSGTSRR